MAEHGQALAMCRCRWQRKHGLMRVEREHRAAPVYSIGDAADGRISILDGKRKYVAHKRRAHTLTFA